MPKKGVSLSPYIYKVLKQVHPDTGISNKAMAVIGDILREIFFNVLNESRKLLDLNEKTSVPRTLCPPPFLV